MVNQEKLEESYRARYTNFLKPLENDLEEYIKKRVAHPRIDRVSVRAKSVSRFLKKAKTEENGQPKYSDPLNQIFDQLGARIVTHYLSDVKEISNSIKDYFRLIEEKQIVPDSPDEFGYEGRHFIPFIPDDLLDAESTPALSFPFFELQIKTLFQYSWGEAAHDLAYKPPTELSTLQRRKVAFTGAQAWGADLIFNELAKELLPSKRTPANH